MRCLLAAGVFVLLAATLTSQETAQEPQVPSGKRNLMVRAEWIEVEHTTLTQLMHQKEFVQNGTKLRIRLQEMVKKNEAAIFDTAIVTLLSGERTRMEAAREWIYPAEYEPPGPRVIGQQSGLQFEREVAPFPITPASATAFQTRPAGVSLEVEALVAEGRRQVELQCAAEFVSKVDAPVLFQRKTSDGLDEAVRFPTFESTRVLTSLTIADGAYVMVGVLVRKAAPEKRLVVMLRCDVLE